ncbi:leucine-rich repeats and immunoglobulin-like domains protein 1 isoform X2 [Pseudorasbora parva]|uniref:leucine-rich repeats and immunoglobulin-like domains protein 1 isoform X2 n=1 Tax=Pseudorasbora parva TaxID=51549 RepID=UPI00351E3648
MGSLWILFTTVMLMPVCVHGAISVHFKTGRPLYVALGRTLVLEATFKKNPDDVIDMVTWDRRSGKDNIRLSGAHGSRISLENDDALLRITDVAEGDFGIYKVTVTDSNGYQQHDSLEVRKIEKPPKASIARVLECVVDKHDMTQWDSPQFSWLVDGVPVNNQTALLGGGSRLDISEVKGVNYTCVTESSLGTHTTHYEAPKESESRPCCMGLIPVVIIIAALLCVAGLFVMKKRRGETSPSYR